MLSPAEFGKNGHSTALLEGDELPLFYQSRVESSGHRWRYGILRARMPAPCGATGRGGIARAIRPAVAL